MQIALTKKLATAMKVDVPVRDESVDPLFTWTANWTSVWDNRSAEDMLVLVNHATRFVVAIYQVKQKDLKNVETMMTEAIRNTLYAMHFNKEMVDEYMRLAGEVAFVKNSDRKAAAHVSTAGRYCAFDVGNKYNGIDKMFADTVGATTSRMIVSDPSSRKGGFYPYEKMAEALAELTGKKIYQYKALELLVSLDLSIYQATRKLIVPAHLTFSQLHELLQKVFDWKNYHVYDFTIYEKDEEEHTARLVPYEEDLSYDETATLIEKQQLSEYITEKNEVIYTYDMGDNWQHRIELIREIDNYNQASPFLLEAKGQAPPEDVGGVPGFLEFRDIMLKEDHPEHESTKKWALFWSLELSDYQEQARVVHV